MIVCPYCKKHKSKRTRACICCKAEALPSCRPERCMILAGLTSVTGLDPNRPIQSRIVPREVGSGWTLCRRCMRDRLAAMFQAQATEACRCRDRCKCSNLQQYYIVADIISHYCGGPWTKDLSVFYWDGYTSYQQLNTWKSREGEEPQEETPSPEDTTQYQWRMVPASSSTRPNKWSRRQTTQVTPPTRPSRWNRRYH